MRTAAELTVNNIVRTNSRLVARRRTIKRRIGMVILMSLLITAFSVIIFGNIIVNAQEESAVTPGFNQDAAAEDSSLKDTDIKGYTSIRIKEGDSLWSIAEEYADEHYSSIYDYILEIKILNGLTSDNIYADSLLVIPIYIDSAVCQN